MVDIEEVKDEPSPSKERLLDAEEIERAAASSTRPSAKIHLEALAKKLRKESEALKRVEASRASVEAPPSETATTSPPPPAAAPAAKTHSQNAVAPMMPSAKYVSIDSFAFDAGKYDSPYVTLYVGLPRVGSIPRESVTCDFTPTSFDLIVNNLNGKSYRLFKDNLEKDIVPDKSKIIVKADKVVVKLAKVKSDYGSYDYWSELTSKHKPKVGADGKRAKEDPSASIMELMKDMYEKGDDNMRKVIGETMLKQRTGELDREGYLSGKGGGLGDMDLDKMDDF